MRTVWKFIISNQTLELKGMLSPRVVHVGKDPGSGFPTVWVEHYTENPNRVLFTPQDIKLTVYGTGQEVADGSHHVGSYINGHFVWHVYAKSTTTRTTTNGDET